MATRTATRYTAVTDKLAKAWHLTSTDRPAGKPYRDKPTVTTYCGKSIWSDPEVGFTSEDLTVVTCGACKRTEVYKAHVAADAAAQEAYVAEQAAKQDQAIAEVAARKAPARKATTTRKSGTTRKPRQTSKERQLAKDAAKLTVVKTEEAPAE